MPRIAKTKKQIAQEIQQKQKIARLKDLALNILEEVKESGEYTISDVKNHTEVLSNIIIEKMAEEENLYKTDDLAIDKVEIEKSNKKLMEVLLKNIKGQNANEMADLLARMGKALQDHGMYHAMQKPYKELNFKEDIIK